MTHKRIWLALLITTFSTASRADTFEVGGEMIVVPAPRGFVRVTENMTALHHWLQQVATSDVLNETLANYVPESVIPTVMAGDVPELKRFFILKVNKKLKNVTVSTAEFAEFKRVARQVNADKSLRNLKPKMREGLRKMNEGVSREFGVDIDFDIGETVGLEPHYEDEDEIAFSSFVNHGMTSGGKKESWIVAGTTTNLTVSGRLLFLYSYGSENDLEWTRATSKDWAARIAARNGPPRQRPRQGRMIDWGKVLDEGITGGLAGGLLAGILTLIVLLRRRRGNRRQ